MNSAEFVNYIKNSGFKLTEWEFKELNVYIGAVKELEKLYYELEGGAGPPYFKKFMFINDYMKILRDLRNIRIGVFYKRLNEKKKYLNRLEMKKEDYEKLVEIYEDEFAKSLNLKFYRKLNKEICFK